MQSLLTNARASSTLPTHVVSLKHVIICRTHVFPDICQSWETLFQERAAEVCYQACIGGMRLRLVEQQAEDSQAWKIRAEKLGGNWEDSDRFLHHQGLPYVHEIIKTELISRHYDDLLASHFGIEKTQKLIVKKYYWETLRQDIEVYLRGCDVCLTSNAIRHKPYENL